MFNRVTSASAAVALVALTWLSGCADLTAADPIRVLKDDPSRPRTIELPANVQAVGNAAVGAKNAVKANQPSGHLPLVRGKPASRKAGGG